MIIKLIIGPKEHLFIEWVWVLKVSELPILTSVQSLIVMV